LQCSSDQDLAFIGNAGDATFLARAKDHFIMRGT
jgi:hypothetical protein